MLEGLYITREQCLKVIADERLDLEQDIDKMVLQDLDLIGNGWNKRKVTNYLDKCIIRDIYSYLGVLFVFFKFGFLSEAEMLEEAKDFADYGGDYMEAFKECIL